MNQDLLKKIAQYVRVKMEIPNQIQGYSDESVTEAVNDMISKKIISFGKAVKFRQKDVNYVLNEGSKVPLGQNEKIDLAMFSETEFEKNYGINWY